MANGDGAARLSSVEWLTDSISRHTKKVAQANPPSVTGTKTARVIVVLPIFNEESNLPRLLDKMERDLSGAGLPFAVIAIDDGSSDSTPEILNDYSARLPLSVHRHGTNEGLGATIRDGLSFAAAIAAPGDIVVTMDSDETHAPSLIAGMVARIRSGSDVVIASRYRPGAKVHGLRLHRRFISWCGSWMLRIVFPTPGISDYTSGYRAYRADVLQQAFARHGSSFVAQNGFQCMLEILLKLRALTVTFDEVPIMLRYDLKVGKSKMRVFNTMIRTAGLIVASGVRR
jgi:dolichol-phosphate mannosyltransferase